MTEHSKHPNTPRSSRFQDYVGDLPHEWILDNLVLGGDGSRRIISSVMIREAVAKFSVPAALVLRFKALSTELRLRCAQVYLMGGNGLLLNEPDAVSKEPLLASLLVYAAQREDSVGPNGQVVRLFGFPEFEPALRPVMAEALAEAGYVGECTPHAAPPPWRPLNDVAALCSLAFQGQLRRSLHGGLARSALNALRKLANDPTLTGRSVPEGLPGHPAGFLIGYCLHDALILDAGPDYLLNRQKFAAWSEKSMKERMHRLTNYAAEYLSGFGFDLARGLLLRCEGRWMSVNSLVPEAERPLLARALGALEFLGCLHTGHSSGALRFAPHKRDDDDIDKLYAKQAARDTVVMADFTVVIPQEAPPSEIFGFSAVGLLTGFDKVYKGQITKSTVSSALRAGVDAAEIREWLRARRASANVAKTVDEWIREFERLFVSHDAAVFVSDEKTAKAISGLEPLRKHLVKVDTHTVFRIRPGSEHKVLDILEKLGFDTRVPDGQAEAAAKHEDVPTDGSSEKKPWKPLTKFSSAAKNPTPPAMKRTKYGSGLKSLELNEMIHVVDYALLTGSSLVIDYEGSAYIKESIYTVTPVWIDRGIDAAVDAEIPCVRGRKRFFLSKIKRIGVIEQ